MKIIRTGHEIADTVARAVEAGGYDADCTIAYGILRGTANAFLDAHIDGKKWFEIDKGYWGSSHYDGYYRVSCLGTQLLWHEGIPQIKLPTVQKRGARNAKGYYLVCPPTEFVAEFFGLGEISVWVDKACAQILQWDTEAKIVVRYKNAEKEEIKWKELKGVYTFNSSVGWEALRKNIPCVSNTQHSAVGSYLKYILDKKTLEYNFNNVTVVDIQELYQAMAAHQFTLQQIKNGGLCQILKHYLKKNV